MPFGFRTAAQGSRDVAALAGQLGYTYSRTDPGNVLGLPFRLFGQRDPSVKVRDFVSGRHGGQPAQLFELDGRTDEASRHGRGIGISVALPTDLTCAVVGIPAAFPPISITRRIGSAVLLRDTDEVQFESDDFNRAFRVHCASEKCAFSLIDGRMMQWLLTQPIPFVVIELAGPYWLAAMPDIMPSGWPVLLSLYDTFGANVPAVALSSFPPPTN